MSVNDLNKNLARIIENLRHMEKIEKGEKHEYTTINIGGNIYIYNIYSDDFDLSSRTADNC